MYINIETCIWAMKHSHLRHGLIVDALWKTNVWAQFLRLALSLWGRPFPFNTSSFIVGSSSSQTLLVDFTFWVYFVQKPRASSMEYPFAMLPSSLAMIRTYPFRAFMYRSIGYIHLVWTGPHRSNSPTICTTNCVITSKVARGNTFSIVDIVSTTSSLNICIVLGSITFEQILLNIWFKLMRDMQISSCINLQRQRGIAYCIKMCNHGTSTPSASHPWPPFCARQMHNVLESSIVWWFARLSSFLHMSRHRAQLVSCMSHLPLVTTKVGVGCLFLPCLFKLPPYISPQK